MKAAILLVAAVAGRAATMTISPPVIYDCVDGAAVATISWSGASGQVQVRLNAPDGLMVTGFSDPSGSVTAAGPWVTDGMKFFLVNQAGIVEAIAVAHVSCGATVRTIDTGLAGGSYFPLQVGNTWIYRINSRIGTGYYLTRSITGTEVIGGKTYFVLAETYPELNAPTVIAKLRGDNSGVLWVATTGGEQAYIPNPQKISYSGPLGNFSDAVSTNALTGGLVNSTTTFVRGIGMAHLASFIMAGSSGGFDESLDLVEVRMPGVQLAVPGPKISISVESTDLDASEQLVPNCALPCYFVACGLGGVSPDPPGTYRPCTQAGIDSTADPGAEVRLELVDANGAVLFVDSRPADANGHSFRYVRLPVYTQLASSTAFTVLPAGEYRVLGRVLEGGQEVASSNINVRVR
jgi:hypothetical protein